MLNLCDPLPYFIYANNNKYQLTPAFDNVLQLYQQLDNNLFVHEQMELMSYYFTKNAPCDVAVINALCDVFFPKSTTNTNNGSKKSFDFVQDAELIYSAFMQSYHIDLIEQQGKLHWLKFLALFSSLPSNTKFSEVIKIRMQPVPKATKYNQEERMALIEAKKNVALVISEEERQRNIQNGLRQIATILLAKKGE